MPTLCSTIVFRALALAGVLGVVLGCESVERLDRKISEAVAADPGMPLTIREEPELRVRVEKGASKAKIDGAPAVVVRPVGVGTPVQLATPLTITSGQTGIRLFAGKSSEATDFPFGTMIEVLPAPGGTVTAAGQQPMAPMVRLNGVAYPGFLIVRPNWQDYPERFDVVNVVGMESYLPGVLAHELPKDWARQAFEMQAVAARTYALHERERARLAGTFFDVEDTTTDQVFGGASELTVAVEAVRATRGMVLTHRGSLLRAYYSSTCGGRPSSAAEVWPTGRGYAFNLAAPLQGKQRASACTPSKFYRWDATRSDDDLSQRIRAWSLINKHPAANITRLREVNVRTRNQADRPATYTLRDSTSREFTMTAEELRAACNQSVSTLSPIKDEARVMSGDMEFEFWADRVRIHGRGFGHAVGMCQWCASGFAQQGWDWRKMAATFYPGAEVKDAY